jgi:hypothetical protein
MIANYRRRTISKVVMILGILSILLGVSLMFTHDVYFICLGVLFIAYGCIAFCVKYIYIRNSMKGVKSNKNFGLPGDISISEEGILSIRQGKDEMKSDMRSYFGYHVYEAGILIYPQRNIFLVMKKDVIGDTQFVELVHIIELLKMKRI